MRFSCTVPRAARPKAYRAEYILARWSWAKPNHFLSDIKLQLSQFTIFTGHQSPAMAKFRMNHARQGKGGGATIIRVALFAAILAGLFVGYQYLTRTAPPGLSEDIVTPADTVDDRSFYLPTGHDGTIIHHPYFSLAYHEEHEQAEWVAYMLTRDRLEVAQVDRPDNYTVDKAIPTGSAEPEDYQASGYDRGHLVPAADMAFSGRAMAQTFVYSNISPQAHDFNTGVWRELEENVRLWARRFKKLYIITGPVLADGGKGTIGENKVTIPNAFYKVVLDLSEPGRKAIAFLIPNTVTYDPLYDYVVSIDSVEARTGLDFFPELMTDTMENTLEANSNIDLWPLSTDRHRARHKRLQ